MLGNIQRWVVFFLWDKTKIDDCVVEDVKLKLKEMGIDEIRG
jgi:hypothetical protein